MATSMFNWREIMNMTEEELKENFNDLELAVIKRHQIVMFLYYQNALDKGGFAGISPSDIDAWVGGERAKLVAEYGEDLVLRLEEGYVRAKYDYDEMTSTMHNVEEFFNATELPPEEVQEIKNITAELNMSEDDFRMASLAAVFDPDVTGDIDRKEGETKENCAIRNYEQMTSKLIHPNEQWDMKSMGKKRDQGMRGAKKLLEEVKRGNPEKMAKAMRESLIHQMKMFSDSHDPKEAAQNGNILRESMKYLEENPQILKCCNFNENEKNSIYGAIQLGETIIKGVHSMQVLEDKSLNNKPMTQQEKEDLTADIIQMQFAFNDKEKQIAQFGADKEKKMPPTKLQMQLGKGITAKEIKAGKRSPECEKIRKAVKMSDFFAQVTKNKGPILADKLNDINTRKKITNMIVGDITKDNIKDKLISSTKEIDKQKKNEKGKVKDKKIKKDVKQIEAITNNKVLQPELPRK